MRNTAEPGTIAYNTHRILMQTMSSARRQIWTKFHNMESKRLFKEYRTYTRYVTDPAIYQLKPIDHQKADLWYLRLIYTELRKRGY